MSKTSIKKDHILVVGGTGFIGTHIVKEALVRGLKVTIISKSHKPFSDRIKDVEYLSVDISQQDNLCNQLKDKTFQYVINLGGYVDHSNYSSGGDMVFNVHFNGTKNLINNINKDSLKSFIQIGSSDEYGSLEAPQDESMKEMPISPYSFAKMSATNLLKMLHITHQFPAVILRFFLVYGPGQEENRFLPQIINGCLNNRDFPVSDGNQLRDFCYIDDAISAILISFSNSKINGEVINIASGNAISIREVITMVQEKIGYG